MINAFTVDLEDWFCSHNLKSVAPYKTWDQQLSRVEKNTMKLLNLLHSHNTKATFFVLGWIASRFPKLVKAIHEEGHEIASHGYAHQQITLQTHEAFEEDIIESISILNSITGERPKGYRAPAFSITQQTLWALSVLKKYGISYDSSIYPFSFHPDYGNAGVPLGFHNNNGLIEIPMSCATFGKIRIPCSGGAYLRFYPFSIFRSLVKRVIAKQRPFIFYIHPWEIDSDPPKVPLPYSKAARHYYNCSSALKKTEMLVQEFQFTSLQNILASEQFDIF
ncbi:MAG TPA: XrtA system polysaccharide deacetylase [Flavisolibacter sp.]|jgi:polysaccharide deacetylase family protein (PEP-CTERM system associated)|nr:XrtA system polysaccharide deacetylase [Flavisolibacter sp.]